MQTNIGDIAEISRPVNDSLSIQSFLSSADKTEHCRMNKVISMGF